MFGKNQKYFRKWDLWRAERIAGSPGNLQRIFSAFTKFTEKRKLFQLGRFVLKESFSKNKITKNTVRTIESFTLNVNNGVLEFSIIGDGFMYNMVRIIVALMLKVGEGRFKPEDIKRILDGKERRLAPFVAAPQGLYLWEVHYDEIYNGSTEPIEK